ncbi:MAG: hypothetical protein ABIU05_11070 [Nitrospirales bacterium]
MRHAEIEISGALATRREARSSLKKFKQSPAYAALLRRTIAESPKLERLASSETERRRVRLDRMQSELELEHFRDGGAADEFIGLMSLPDPLKGA